MAKQGIVGTAQDTIVGAAKTSAEGVRSLAGSRRRRRRRPRPVRCSQR